MHISSRYAKLLGETNFRTREIPRSGSKTEDGKERKKERRAKVGGNNGQATHGARKPPGPKEINMNDFIGPGGFACTTRN